MASFRRRPGRALLHEYRAPLLQLTTAVEDAIHTRELAIEDAEQNLVLEWLTDGGKSRRADEQKLAATDWNASAAPGAW